jgi:hypothetical protein
MTGASFHKGASKQDYGTPWEFINAVRTAFGPLTFDLAATADNRKTPAYLGPGSEYGEDALNFNWNELPLGRWWLNPPFADIKPWVAACAKLELGWRTASIEQPMILPRGTGIYLLVPAAVGTNYWAEYVHNRAHVYFLLPRLTFVGHTEAYPKDCALCVYRYPWVIDKPDSHYYHCWRWKALKKKRRKDG